METQTLKGCTSLSTMEKLSRKAEESRKIVHRALKIQQRRFDWCWEQPFVPSAGDDLVTLAQANAELEEALSKVSKLESKNSSLEDCLKNKEEDNFWLLQIKTQLEEELELSERSRETFEEEMAALDLLHEEKLAEMRKKMKENDVENEALRKSVKQLTLTVKQLDEALQQKEDCQAEKTAQATQTEGELDSAEMDIDDLRRQLCQEQMANAAGKKLVEDCNEKERRINILQCQLQDRAVTKVDQACQCEEMDQEEVNITLQDLQEQLENEEQDKEQYKAHLDGLYVEYKQTCDWLHHYDLENNKLQEQLKNEEQDKEYYKGHLDGLCGEHERTCKWLDHYVLENNELKSYIEVLEEYQCEASVMDQEEVNITLQNLQDQLKKEEQDKEQYKAHLDGLHVEYKQTRDRLHHYVLENDKLQEQVKNEKQAKEYHKGLLGGLWPLLDHPMTPTVPFP